MSEPKQSGDREHWQRVEAICEQALGFDGPERGRYVAGACGADEGLRREVEALLARESAADGFLSTPIAKVSAELLAPPSRDLIGKRIGDFEILGPLGAGGMGVVYRARDHRLDRDVAIKVLPDNLASDPERLLRLRREAKLLATVSHPHVGAIYELIETEGTCALVLELLEGESLDAVLARGPMRVAMALSTAIQIAEALDHVHQRGVTHRDLKPANVMLTKTGARLVDFGVGKWSAAAAAHPAGFTTETGDGRLIGTLNYMSPEQLEGREAGPGSDLFAFGAVVYEMLTGRRAFDGQSQAGVVAAIIKADPPPLDTAARELIPPRLERVIRKCLAKDPAARWQSARDLADELRWIKEDGPEKPAGAVRTTRTRVLVAVAALAVVAATVAFMGWSGRLWTPAPGAAGPISFVINAPPTVGMAEGHFAIAPDGNFLVFRRGQRFSGPQLMVRRLNQLEPVGISPGPTWGPAISPDGESVVFESDRGVLNRMSLRGDAPTVLVSDAGDVLRLDWSVPDSILVSAIGRPIRRVSSNGGELTDITDVRRPAEVDHHSPQMLPGGQAFLFAIHRQRNRFAVAVQSLRTGERKTLIEDAYSPRYSPTGHLLFARGTKLWAAPFDLDALAVTGPAVTIMDGMTTVAASGEMYYRLSQSGSLAYQPQRPQRMKTMVWVDRAGKETPLPLPPNTYEAPRLSPDGRRLAFGTSEPWRVFVYEFATDKLIALSPVDGISWGPIWSADGSLLYAVDRPDASHILHYRFDGSPAVSIGSSINDLWPAGLTADGMLIVSEDPPTNQFRVTRLRPGAGATPEEFAGPAGLPYLPRVSPDGRWVAFTAVEGGRLQIFVQAAVGNGPRRQITVDGGREPVWRRDGRELYFRREDGLLVVTVEQGSELSWSKPALLFRGQFADTRHDFDVAPDGRFMMIKNDPQERPTVQLNVVLNWAGELLTRVPRPR